MLLGLDLYAYTIRFDDFGEPLPNIIENTESPRTNFDTPLNGIITIIIVMIGDDWNSVMYDHYRVLFHENTFKAYLAVFFFVFLFIATNLILLNLFLAILLNNFSDTPEDQEEEENDPADDQVLLFWYKIRICFARCAPKLCPKPPGFNEQLELELKEEQDRANRDQNGTRVHDMVIVDEGASESKSSFPTDSLTF
jgi:hypothetical protein